MAFVNQRSYDINEAELTKYNNLYVQANGGKGGLRGTQWTIDREREMLLVRLYEERGDMSGFDKFTRSRWVFYWHGEWVEFWHKSHGEKLADNHWKMMRIIQKIAMPTSVKKSEQNFFNDLKEAFEVYRIIGVGEEGEEYLFELTLDISEVL
jgi:hypothetical protein